MAGIVNKVYYDRLKANECESLLGRHQEHNVPLYSLENTELRFADLSGTNFRLISNISLIGLKIALLKFTDPKY